MDVYHYQITRFIHKTRTHNTFINQPNTTLRKNQGKRLLWYKKTPNNVGPTIFGVLSSQLILINVKDTCKTPREIFIQWYNVHW